VVVTISNLYGSGGLTVAQRVGSALGYEYVDRQLPVVVAKRMRITTEQAEAADEAGRSFGSRLLSSLELATPEITVQPGPEKTFDDEYVRHTQLVVREFASHGNVVIAGRAGGAILGRSPDVVRVFLYAPRDWRIERVARKLGVDQKTAAAEVDRIDRARRAHLRDWYGVEMGSPDVCDLAMDVSTLGIDACAELIVAAVRARS
jgi:CMP/dCMP kinase